MTIFHQHQLQILINKWLYEKQHQDATTTALLIYITNETQIDVFFENQFNVKLTKEGINALVMYSNLTNKQLYSKKRKNSS